MLFTVIMFGIFVVVRIAEKSFTLGIHKLVSRNPAP